MRRDKRGPVPALALCLALLLPLLALPASANSAQSYWRGTTAAGALVTGEDCPLVVEKEVLTFDLEEFPQQYYNEAADYLAYPGRVRAQYTFHNPADYAVEATLVFPFGTRPDYGLIRDPETDQVLSDPGGRGYGVTADGQPVPVLLRHTYSPWGAQFDLDTDMARLHDGFLEDPFYRPDLPVTRYIYRPVGVDLDAYPAANAAFVWTGDPDSTRVLMENQNGGRTLADGVQLECWVEEGSFAVNFLGEPPEEPLTWTFYENGACQGRIEGTMELADTQTTTLGELLLRDYDPACGVLDYDWFNAAVEALGQLEWEHGVIMGGEFSFDLSGQLMGWYQYQLALAPGATLVNTVTAPMYPTVDGGYEPPIYQYTYLLSPARSWAGFGTLDITLNTPFVLTQSDPGGFEAVEGGYALHLDGLPQGELTFTLCAQAGPSSLRTTLPEQGASQWLLFAGTVILIPALLTAALAARRRQKS